MQKREKTICKKDTLVQGKTQKLEKMDHSQV